MKNLLKPLSRLAAIAVLCAALSACSQPSLPGADNSFPSYSAPTASVSAGESLSIMDY